MLKIVNNANGLVLELDPAQVISIEKNNPLFNDSDDFFQDISYSGTAPLSENNKLFINLAHLVETPNSEYNIPVTSYIEEIPINAGILNFRIGQDDHGPTIEFNLEINYTAINALVKNIKITEILSPDCFEVVSVASMEALMLDTVQFPEKYNYIFFPVYNPSFGDPDTGDSKYYFVNYFDDTTQSFKADKPSGTIGGWNFAISPYFKLTYILAELCAYLGFNFQSGLISDPNYKNMCIYTRQRADILLPNFTPPQLYFFARSMRHMPSMLINDFLKQIRDRLHLVFDFDSSTGIASVETFSSIVANADTTDLTPYIDVNEEEEVPENTGSTVTLKSDEQDARFKVTSNGQDSYPALFQLKSGDGSNVVELDCSTTQLVEEAFTGRSYCATDQFTYNYGTINDQVGSISNNLDATTWNDWPLRLIRFTGYKPSILGKYFPYSEPVNLDDNDKKFYRFQNDSKRLIISAHFPPTVLVNLKMTKKYCYKTPGLNYQEFIIEKIMYDLNVEQDLIPAKLYVRTLNAEINTRVSIQPINNPTTSPYTFGLIKAYFDNGVHGIDQLNVQVAATGAAVGHNAYTVDPIVVPTTVKGTGGQIIPIIMVNQAGADIELLTAQIRITQGNPKYVEHRGVKYNFNWSGSFWYVDIDMSTDADLVPDFYWISF